MAWRQRRCPVPADWFYEWQEIDEEQMPFTIAEKEDAMVAFAGFVGDVEGQGNRAEAPNVYDSHYGSQRDDGADPQSLPVILHRWDF